MGWATEAGREDTAVGAEASCGMPAFLGAARTFPFKDRSLGPVGLARF